uniref:Uncharacterized protein n=1 Tax=uncultured marine virus TaxID=186617 RepID=A0A0F7LB80_9VIRU|nr:hypothetical protein [uncultured marine virus]
MADRRRGSGLPDTTPPRPSHRRRATQRDRLRLGSRTLRRPTRRRRHPDRLRPHRRRPRLQSRHRQDSPVMLGQTRRSISLPQREHRGRPPVRQNRTVADWRTENERVFRQVRRLDKVSGRRPARLQPRV